MARPPKLTAEVRERIVQAVRAGNTREATADYAGIGKTTLYRWLERGKESPRGLFGELWNAVKKAEADCEVRNVGIIQMASQGGQVTERKTVRRADGTVEVVEKYAHAEWTAAAWWLERRRPAAWGRKDRHAVTGAQGQPIQHEHRHDHQVTLDEYRQLPVEEKIRLLRGEMGLAEDNG